MIAEPVPTGLDFTGATLRLMQSHMDTWGRHPFIVQLARQVASMAKVGTPDDEAWAVWAWIRANVEYRSDPVGTQWIQDPYETAVKSRAGNCANMAVLAGSMLQALGHPARAVAVQWKDRDDWTHAVAFDQKTGHVVDPVSPTYAWPPGNKAVEYLVDADGNMDEGYKEEGRGLGFSIGGWHPFQIATYLPTLKKLDPLANTALGKAVWKPIEKVNQTINKDFAKAKVWSQEHRTELQMAAAIAAAIVTAGVASGAIGAAEAGAAEAGAGAAAAETGAELATVTTATTLPSEALTALAPSAYSAADLAVMTPGVVPTIAAPMAVGSYALDPSVQAAASSSGWGSTAAEVGRDALLIQSLAKAAGLIPSGAQGSAGTYYGTGYGSSYGGGGSAGPFIPDTQTTLPRWMLPAGILLALFLITR